MICSDSKSPHTCMTKKRFWLGKACVHWMQFGSVTTWDLGDRLPFSASVFPFPPPRQGSYNSIQAPPAVKPGRELCWSRYQWLRQLDYKASPRPPWLEAWNDLGVSNWACPTWQQHLPLPDPRGQRYIVSVKACASRRRHFTTWSQSVRHWKGDKDNKRNVVSR